MDVNPNLTFLRENYLSKHIISLRGGSRSGKTYSVIQFLIELCFKYRNAGMTITIARLTLPSLKASAMRDFFDLLNTFDGYDERNHNKTENTYELEGNLIEFVSLDQPQKVRGRKRDILFGNEFNEASLEAWNQLMMRTTGFAIIDYNPSDPEHWIYDDVETRDDCGTLVTTYKDNFYLSAAIINEIERFKKKDPDYWSVYGEGKRSAGRKGQIFTDWKTIDKMPWEDCGTVLYGLDFGFASDPTALIKVGRLGEIRYVEELIYQAGLLPGQLAKQIKQLGVGNSPIIADSARPDIIAELQMHGLQVYPVKKKGVAESVIKMKELTIFVHYASANILKEKQWYAWRLDKAGKPTDEPIDSHNHAMDAIRYTELMRII